VVTTSDSTVFRYIRLFVDGPGRSEEISLAESLEDVAIRAQIFPADHFLRQLADAVAAREQHDGRPVSTVRVEAWRIGFHGSVMHGTERRVRSFTLHVQPRSVVEE
jgi:hypothetical protein